MILETNGKYFRLKTRMHYRMDDIESRYCGIYRISERSDQDEEKNIWQRVESGKTHRKVRLWEKRGIGNRSTVF